MANLPLFADRVKETTTTTSTGTLTTLGAATNFQTFLAAFGTGNQAFYVIEDNTNNVWEVGIGTVTSGSLTRDVILANSSGTFVALNLSAGTKNVFCDLPSRYVNNLAGLAMCLAAGDPPF